MQNLGWRERELVEAVFRLKRASVRDVVDSLVDPPSYSAVRATLNILEKKGVLRHVEEGRRFLYVLANRRRTTQQSVLRRVVEKFFGNSIGEAVHALIDIDGSNLSDDELDALVEKINAARRKVD